MFLIRRHKVKARRFYPVFFLKAYVHPVLVNQIYFTV